MSDSPSPETITFDAAAYVKLWRDYGNVVYLTTGLKGRPSIGIYFPDDAKWPPMSELERYRTGKQHDPSWKQAIIDLLQAEGA
jgi:hypothetical protein